MRTNIVLKKVVSIARQAGLMKDLSSEELKCGTHKETKRIFCVESRIFLCPLCPYSHEHRGHRHCPIEAAAEGQMERLVKQMASLREKIQEIRENIEAEKRTTTLWVDYVTAREEMIRWEYRKLHPLLCGEGQKHVESMRHEGQRGLEKLGRSGAMMVEKSKQLREMYQELIAMSQQPYVVLLQGLEDMFRRSESVQLSMPQPVKPELSALPITGLTERFNHIQVNIFFENVTTLHCKRNLFNAMRRFSFRPHHKDTSVDPDGCYLASWGSQSFISGKYYWEVDLKDSWDWAVGVCKDSWLWNRNQQIEREVRYFETVLLVNLHSHQFWQHETENRKYIKKGNGFQTHLTDISYVYRYVYLKQNNCKNMYMNCTFSLPRVQLIWLQKVQRKVLE
ncbi:hypothetical protein STEG23_002092, partial [Scotinomys teguina]